MKLLLGEEGGVTDLHLTIPPLGRGDWRVDGRGMRVMGGWLLMDTKRLLKYGWAISAASLWVTPPGLLLRKSRGFDGVLKALCCFSPHAAQHATNTTWPSAVLPPSSPGYSVLTNT